MNLLAVLADPILPVFAILALGYVLGWRGRIGIDAARQINNFAMNVLLPVMIFGLVAAAPIRSFPAASVLGYLSAEVATATAGFWIARRMGREGREALLLGASCIFANNAFFVLPISVILYGPQNVLPITAIITVDGVLAFSAIIIGMQLLAGGRPNVAGVARALIRSPLIWSIVAGLALNAAQVPLPGPARTFVDFNGVAAAPVALFALGVVLSQERLRLDRVVVVFSGMKLAVFPAVVWTLLRLLPGDARSEALFLLGSAGPSSTAMLSLAVLHGVRTDALGPIMVWTCLLALISLAILA